MAPLPERRTETRVSDYKAAWSLDQALAEAHRCLYCYACFMQRFSGHDEPWGDFVDVKTNAVTLLEAQMERHPSARVLLSSVTDCYQPAEEQYRLTAGCLAVLTRYPFAEVSILTKSALLTRDLSVLRELPSLQAGMTITTLRTQTSNWLEPGASTPARRLDALDRLARAGISTWAFAGPLLPGIADDEASVAALLGALTDVGVSAITVDAVNLYPAVYPRLVAGYQEHAEWALPALAEAYRRPEAYGNRLRALVKASVRPGMPDVRWAR